MQVTRVNQKYRPPRRDLFEGAHGTLQSGHDLDSISHGSLSISATRRLKAHVGTTASP